MTSITRESVVQSIEALLVEAKNLSDDIFEDQIMLQSFQRQVFRLKNDTTAPLERIFGEICFQVWPHPWSTTAWMLMLRYSLIRALQ